MGLESQRTSHSDHSRNILTTAATFGIYACLQMLLLRPFGVMLTPSEGLGVTVVGTVGSEILPAHSGVVLKPLDLYSVHRFPWEKSALMLLMFSVVVTIGHAVLALVALAVLGKPFSFLSLLMVGVLVLSAIPLVLPAEILPRGRFKIARQIADGWRELRGAPRFWEIAALFSVVVASAESIRLYFRAPLKILLFRASSI